MQMEHCPTAPKSGSNAMAKIVFSQAKTFSREKLASDWAKRLELALELELDGEIERRNRADTTNGVNLKTSGLE